MIDRINKFLPAELAVELHGGVGPDGIRGDDSWGLPI